MRKLTLAALFVGTALPSGAQAVCSPWNPANPKCWVRRANAAMITGSGSISPGLNETPRPQSLNFTGTAQVVGTDGVLASYACAFSGTDLAGSLTQGVGTVAGSCGPISLPTCAFARVGVAVGVVCATTSTPSLGAASCVFTPNNTNPVTSYSLVCLAGYAGA